MGEEPEAKLAVASGSWMKPANTSLVPPEGGSPTDSFMLPLEAMLGF